MRAVRKTSRVIGGILILLLVPAGIGLWYAFTAPQDNSETLSLGITDDSLTRRETSVRPVGNLTEPLADGTGIRFGALRLWHAGADTNKELQFLSDGRTLVSGTQNSVRFWDASTGRLLRETSLKGEDRPQPGVRTRQSGVDSLSGMRLAPDGRRVAVLSATTFAGPPQLQREPIWRLRIWDAATTSLESSLEWSQKFDEFNDFQFTPDGSTLFVGDSRGSVHVWDLNSGKEISTKKLCQAEIMELAVSPDGEVVAVSAACDELFLWKWRSTEEASVLAEPWPRRGLAFSLDGKSLAVAAGFLRQIHVWDVDTGKIGLTLSDNRASSRRFEHPTFTSDGASILAASRPVHDDGTAAEVLMWDAASGRLTKRVQTSGLNASKLVISPDGTLLAAAGAVPQIHIWLLTTGELAADNTHSGHFTSVNFMSFLPDSDCLFATSSDGACKVWDTRTGHVRRQYAPAGIRFRAVAVSPDGRLVAASAMDDSVYLVETATGNELRRFKGHGGLGGHGALAFSSDGNTLQSWGDGDFTLRRWNVNTGEILSEFQLTPSSITRNPMTYFDVTGFRTDGYPGIVAARFLPDGETLFLVSTASYWIFKTATGRQDSEWHCPFPTSSIAIGPFGERLYLAGWTRGAMPQGNLCHACAIDLRTDQILWSNDFDGSMCTALTVSPDGKFVAVSVHQRAQDRTSFPDVDVKILDAATGELLATAPSAPMLPGPGDQVFAMGNASAFSADGRKLAFAQQDNSFVIWDLTKLDLAKQP